MKKVYTDPEVGVDIMERMHHIREGFRYIMRELRGIEEDFFSLTGETFGHLKVLGPAGHQRQTDEGVVYTPAWLCECSCGQTCVVDHKDLINNAVTSCGGSDHE